MPKSYSESERANIIKKLKTEANLLIAQYGYRKTSVDELVRRANIPKGTFYLFYDSKELFMFDVILEEHNAIQRELIGTITGYDGFLTKEQFAELIFHFYKKTTHSFLYPLITNGELEIIMRKLPDEIVSKHIEHDDFSVEKLFALIPQAKNKDINVFSAALRGIFLMTMHKKEVGETVFDDAVRLLIGGLAEQIFKEEI